jgi:hypothetical protein
VGSAPRSDRHWSLDGEVKSGKQTRDTSPTKFNPLSAAIQWGARSRPAREGGTWVGGALPCLPSSAKQATPTGFSEALSLPSRCGL